LEEKFGNLKNVTLNAVIDCGNGTAGTVIPKLIKKMGWKNIKLLCSEVDGTFPNHEADPTVPANMIMVKEALVSDNTLSVGLGLDGDCDRMNPMTKEGELIAGDKLLALFAQRALKDFPGASVVFDIKSSSSLIELLTKWGAKPCISPSGHSLIKETMAKTNAKLAGELSCHFFFHDRYFGYDDGIYAALRLFELLVTSGKTLTQLLTIIPHKENSPEIRIECASDEEKLKIVEHVKKVFSTRTDAKLITIDGIRAQMPYGWGLLRASNTQPVICLRFESETKEGLLRVKRDFFTGLQKLFDENKLKEQIGI
jgi:phosphomannomutase